MNVSSPNSLVRVLLAAAACAQAAAAQVAPPTVVNFGPNPPVYVDWSASNLPSLRNLRTTLGDVNADGVTDFVFSNQLGYLAVYLFPDESYQLTPTRLLIRDTGMAAGDTCDTSTNPAIGWRRATLSQGQDDVLIYDIDLDGKAEIITTELAFASPSTAEVGLCIYDIDTIIDADGNPFHTWSMKSLTSNYVSFHPISNPPAFFPNVAPIGKTFSPQGGPSYFQCGDKPGQVGTVVRLAIGNVRGRATPQDILVWTVGQNRDFDHSVYGYSNGQGTNPNTLDVLMHVSPGYDGEIPNLGEPGHTRILVDVNGDGKDEVFGRHLFEYDPTIDLPSEYNGVPHVKNGRYLWSVQFLQGIDKHMDGAVGGDIIRSYRDATTGRVAAAPGAELAMTPQHPVDNGTSIDGGSAWIVRGVTGFQAPKWPRMIISHSASHDYFTPYNASSYVEPLPTSNWDSLGTAFSLRNGSSVVGDLDSQEIYLGNFLASSEGPELIVTYKSTPRSPPLGWSFPDLMWRLNGSLIGTDEGLTVHNWWFNYGKLLPAPGYGQDTQRNGPGFRIHQTDFHGTRDEIECASEMIGLLLGLPGFNYNNYSDPFHKVIFQLTGGLTSSNPIRYEAYPSKSTSGADSWYGGAASADMFGDSREEYVIVFRSDPNPAYAHILSSNDTATGSSRVNHRSPEEFLDYQRKRGATTVDFKRYDAPHVYSDVLPKGIIGQVYGRALDRAFWPVSGTQVVGAGLLPEGGQAPYTITLVEGILHAGLQPVSRPVRDHTSAGSPLVAQYAGALCIEGTPQESGLRKLRFRVDDSGGRTVFQDLWIHVTDPIGGASSDPRPKILAGGFDGTYLQGGVPQDVIVRAFVGDNQGDCSGVAVLDAAGAPLLGLVALDNGLAANGDLVAGDGVFSAKAAGVSLPTGFNLNPQMIAFDAVGHVSPTWPFMQVEGGNQGALPTFETAAPPATQTQAQTPTIEYVYMPATELPAAEETDATGTQVVIAVLKYVPAGATVTEVRARIHHPVAGVTPFDLVLTPTAPGSLTWVGSFATPSGEIGYGRYSVNVRAKVTVTGTSTEYVSDWWPSLRWH